jgi:hypothetical protein
MIVIQSYGIYASVLSINLSVKLQNKLQIIIHLFIKKCGNTHKHYW